MKGAQDENENRVLPGIGGAFFICGKFTYHIQMKSHMPVA
jgi:hypothetical protein